MGNRVVRRRRVQKAEAARARRIRRPLLSALELPEDASGTAARLLILGGERALVENCRGVEEIGDRRVRLRLSEGTLVFEGEGLSLCDVRADAVCVCGRLHSVRFPGAPEAAHD